MTYLIYISLLTISLNAQTIVPECGMTLRDTLVTQYVDFGSCGNLVMTNESYLKVEYLTGNGVIRYVDNETEVPTIEFTSCYPYQQGNVVIDSEITVIFPNGCETLNIDDISPHDTFHLYNFKCKVYNILGQEIYDGIFGELKINDIGIYFCKFEFITIKIPVIK